MLQNAIKKLPPTQAELLKLKISGLNQRDIAEVLQVPLGTVKSRFHSLVEFLKKEIQE
jgi:RNA polymerase sigma factor (sigma-70 family)